MKAEILPLDGKYYGTIIKILDDFNNEYKIKLWNNGNFEPSDREVYICDSHFESRQTYVTACKIVELLNV